jgi:hypothetical protein
MPKGASIPALAFLDMYHSLLLPVAIFRYNLVAGGTYPLAAHQQPKRHEPILSA